MDSLSSLHRDEQCLECSCDGSLPTVDSSSRRSSICSSFCEPMAESESDIASDVDEDLLKEYHDRPPSLRTNKSGKKERDPKYHCLMEKVRRRNTNNTIRKLSKTLIHPPVKKSKVHVVQAAVQDIKYLQYMRILQACEILQLRQKHRILVSCLDHSLGQTLGTRGTQPLQAPLPAPPPAALPNVPQCLQPEASVSCAHTVDKGRDTGIGSKSGHHVNLRPSTPSQFAPQASLQQKLTKCTQLESVHDSSAVCNPLSHSQEPSNTRAFSHRGPVAADSAANLTGHMCNPGLGQHRQIPMRPAWIPYHLPIQFTGTNLSTLVPTQNLLSPTQNLLSPTQILLSPTQTLLPPSPTVLSPSQIASNCGQMLFLPKQILHSPSQIIQLQAPPSLNFQPSAAAAAGTHVLPTLTQIFCNPTGSSNGPRVRANIAKNKQMVLNVNLPNY